MKRKMNKPQKTAKLILAMVFLLAFASQLATAQDRRGEDKRQRKEDKHAHNVKPQQQRPAINQPQMNRPQVVNRTTTRVVNRTTPRIVNRTTIVNRTPNRGRGVRPIGNRSGYRPQGWAPTRRPYTRAPIIYGGRRFYAYHSYYPHPFTAFRYGPTWHPLGFFLTALVGTAIVIDLENRSYHYSAGVFYAPYNNGYQVVPAPYGAYVPSIPQGYQQVSVGGQSYYYYGGAFFVLNGNNYEVVQAPSGAVVYNLPEGATQEQVDNYMYMQYNGTYYQPIQINGQNAYEVVELEPDTQQQQLPQPQQ